MNTTKPRYRYRHAGAVWKLMNEEQFPHMPYWLFVQYRAG